MKKILLKLNEHTLAYLIQLISSIIALLIVYFNHKIYMIILCISIILSTVLFIHRKNKVINFKKKENKNEF